MDCRENGTLIDVSFSGRGLQPRLLILMTYPGANQGAVLFRDAFNSHLEILPQRQINQPRIDVDRESLPLTKIGDGNLKYYFYHNNHLGTPKDNLG